MASVTGTVNKPDNDVYSINLQVGIRPLGLIKTVNLNYLDCKSQPQSN